MRTAWRRAASAVCRIEVSNHLSSAFNQTPDVIRVRVKPIEPLGEDALAWLTTAVRKRQLEGTGGLGKLFLFSR